MKQRIVYSIIISIILIYIEACDRELSISQPESPPQQAKITIETKPGSYSIHLNNHIMGRWTPDSMTFLDAGTYEVELRDSIYLDTLFTVNLDTNETKTIYIDMTLREEFYGSLQINASGKKSEIIINTPSTGIYTPGLLENLYPGTYKVDLRKKGFRSFEKEIIVKSNETTNHYGILVDTTIWLVYTTDDCEMISSSLACIVNNLNITDELWVGTNDNGIVKYNEGIFKNYNLENTLLPALSITDILVIKDGTVFASSFFWRDEVLQFKLA